jgi:hypothetical protein
VNLQSEEALPGRRRGHMVTKEGEEATGAGGDEGNQVEQSFVSGDGHSPLKWPTEEDGVGVWLNDLWRRETLGVRLGLADYHLARGEGGATWDQWVWGGVCDQRTGDVVCVGRSEGKKKKKWVGPKETMSFLNYSNIFQLT